MAIYSTQDMNAQPYFGGGGGGSQLSPNTSTDQPYVPSPTPYTGGPPAGTRTGSLTDGSMLNSGPSYLQQTAGQGAPGGPFQGNLLQQQNHIQYANPGNNVYNPNSQQQSLPAFMTPGSVNNGIPDFSNYAPNQQQQLMFDWNFFQNQLAGNTPQNNNINNWGWDPYKLLGPGGLMEQNKYPGLPAANDPNSTGAFIAPGLGFPGTLPANNGAPVINGGAGNPVTNPKNSLSGIVFPNASSGGATDPNPAGDLAKLLQQQQQGGTGLFGKGAYNPGSLQNFLQQLLGQGNKQVNALHPTQGTNGVVQGGPVTGFNGAPSGTLDGIAGGNGVAGVGGGSSFNDFLKMLSGGNNQQGQNGAAAGYGGISTTTPFQPGQGFSSGPGPGTVFGPGSGTGGVQPGTGFGTTPGGSMSSPGGPGDQFGGTPPLGYGNPPPTGGTNATGTGTPDQALATLPQDMGFLRNLAQNAGYPADLSSLNGLQSFAGGQQSPSTNGLSYLQQFMNGGNQPNLSSLGGLQGVMGGSQADLSQLGGLQSIIAGKGNPTNATPAWQSMVDAQQRQVQENAANLQEKFGVSGNRFSTAFGTGMSDYYSQTSKDQNALLGQMTQQAQEAAAQRQLTASGQVGQIGTDALNQMMQRQATAAGQYGQLGVGASLSQLQNQLGAAGQYGQTSTAASMAQQANQLQGAGQYGQLALNSQDQARQRELMASQQLSQQGYGATGQLSGQGFQSQMQQQQQQLQSALAMMGYGSQAAGQLASQGANATSMMNQNAYNAATGLNQNAYNSTNMMNQLGGNAANSLYGTENAAAMQQAQLTYALQQLGMQGGSQFNNAWNQNLQTGSQIGGQQMQLGQQQLSAMYQEWMRQQPQYNPLLSMGYGAATNYPQFSTPNYQPGSFGGIAGGIGSLLQGLGGIDWGKLFGGGGGGGLSGQDWSNIGSGILTGLGSFGL